MKKVARVGHPDHRDAGRRRKFGSDCGAGFQPAPRSAQDAGWKPAPQSGHRQTQISDAGPLAAVLLALALLALIAAAPGETRRPAPASSPTPASYSADFAQAASLFVKGDDVALADFVIAAAREDPRCLWLLYDPRFTQWPPAQACGEVQGVKPVSIQGDPAPHVLYQLAGMKTSWVRERQGEAAARTAGLYFLRRLLRDFPSGEPAARAAYDLIGLELCRTDAGYPDCAALEIRRLEDWLRAYPTASLLPQALKRTARLYLDLADRYEQDGPWRSPLRAELLRGRALELAQNLASDGRSPDDSRWAADFRAQVLASGKSFSMIPEGALVPSGAEEEPGRE